MVESNFYCINVVYKVKTEEAYSIHLSLQPLGRSRLVNGTILNEHNINRRGKKTLHPRTSPQHWQMDIVSVPGGWHLKKQRGGIMGEGEPTSVSHRGYFQKEIMRVVYKVYNIRDSIVGGRSVYQTRNTWYRLSKCYSNWRECQYPPSIVLPWILLTHVANLGTEVDFQRNAMSWRAARGK